MPSSRTYQVDAESLETIARLPQAKLVHGVGFPLGGTVPFDPRSLPPIRESIRLLGAAWASEHLGFNQATRAGEAFNAGFLLPPRQSDAGVAVAAANIRRFASQLPVPFAIETGVNYLQPREDELDDGSFVAAVAAAADCGILLDLHNVYVNERNGRQPAREFLSQLPLERVWEVHVAGGFELAGYWLDAHSGEIPFPLKELAAEVIPELPNLRAVIFEILPEYVERLGLDGIRGELSVLDEYWQGRPRSDRAAKRHRSPLNRAKPSSEGPSPAEWETALASLTVGQEADEPLAAQLAEDPGTGILRTLAEEARAGMTIDSLPMTARLLGLSLGGEGLRDLLSRFWRSQPPQLFPSSEAQAFADWLDDHGPAIPFLDDVLGYDLALLRARVARESTIVRFTHSPAELLTALNEGRLPERLAEEAVELVVEPAAKEAGEVRLSRSALAYRGADPGD